MENKTNRFTPKKCLAVLVSVLMIVSLLPMTVFADDTVIANGQCGATAYWKIVDDGTDKTFVVYGTGDMWTRTSWTGDEFDAWDITKLVIEYGITSIGEDAFGANIYSFSSTEQPEKTGFGGCYQNGSYWSTKAFENATGSLTIPDSVTSIGVYAFYGCSGFNGTLTLGNSIQTIGPWAFRDCSGLTGSLVIPDSVTSIGSSAFMYCSGFTGPLTIPDLVTSINEYTFYYCSGFNGSLSIGKSVTLIGSRAFGSCTGLTGNLIIPDSVKRIEALAFEECTGFSGGLLTLGDSLEYIGGHAFRYCGFVGDLVIPDTVKEIGYLNVPNTNGAFQGCNFDGTLTLGSSLELIGEYSFEGCKFSGELTFPDSLVTIGKCAFSGCSGFTGTLDIPDSLTTIGKDAFHGCAANTNGSSTYNGKLEDSNPYKFYEHYRGDSADDDYQFIEVVEGDRTEPTPTTNGTQVYYIYCVDDSHKDAESGEMQYTYLNLVATVYEPIEYQAVNVTGITPASDSIAVDVGSTQQLTVTVEPSNATNPAVTYSSSDETVATVSENGLVAGVGDGTATITITAADGSGVSTTVTVTVTDPSIIARGQCGDTAYWKIVDDGTDKTFVVYGEGDMWRRRNWTGDDFDAWDITAIVIEDGITSIGQSAFGPFDAYNNPDLEEVPPQSGCGGWYLHYGNTYSPKAFKNAKGTLTIPDSVTKIEGGAFEECSGLTGSLELSDNITSIGYAAFRRCTGFTGDLVIPDSVISLGGESFRDTGFDGTLTISGSLTRLEYCTFAYNSKLSGSIIIPNGIEVIDTSVFASCRGFTGNIVIPDSVTSIGQGAFRDCSNLSGILIIPDSVTSIGTDAFHGTAANTNGSSTYNGKLEDSNPYKFFEHYRGDSAEDKYQFIEVVDCGITNDPTPDQNGTYTYKIYCIDDSHRNESTGDMQYSEYVNLVATVNEPIEYVPVTSVTASPATVELEVGSTQQLTVEVVPGDATNGNVTYTSSNTDVATVSADGFITAVGAGDAVITVAAADGTGTPATVTVSVAPVHDLIAVPAKDATDEADGNKAYYYCDKHENEYFWDEEATQPVTWDEIVIHNPGEPVIENSVLETETTPASFDLVTYCTNDGEELDRQHIELEVVPANDATDGEDGNIKYYKDEDGNKYVYDEDEGEFVPVDDVTVHNPGEPVIENSVLETETTPASFDLVTYCTNDGEELYRQHVELEVVPAKDATDGEDGNIKYYKDEDGNKYVYDEDEGEFVPVDDVTAHNPGEPVIENSVLETETTPASFDLVTYCTNDGEELDRQHVELEKHEAKDPTGNEDGNDEYYEDKDGNKYVYDEETGEFVPVDDETITRPRVHADSVEATATKTELDANDRNNNTAKISATVGPENATNKNVTFTSSDESVVKVDANGNVKAVGRGTAIVTVASESDPDVTTTVTFTVTKDDFSFSDGENSTYEIGDTGTIKVDADTDKEYTVEYSSSNGNVITVDKDTGAFEAIGAGNATITAKIKFADGTEKVITKNIKVVDNSPFRCWMCPTYEKYKSVPVIGIIITIIHFFVHLLASRGIC